MSCLAGKLSPTSDGGFNNCRAGRVSFAEHGTLKGKIVWLGGSRRRLTVVSELPCRTGKPCRAWT